MSTPGYRYIPPVGDEPTVQRVEYRSVGDGQIAIEKEHYSDDSVLVFDPVEMVTEDMLWGRIDMVRVSTGAINTSIEKRKEKP